jgi:hypothetical protein
MGIGKTIVFLVLGIAGWFAAALYVRFFGDQHLSGGVSHILAFLSMIIVAPVSTWIAAKIVRHDVGDMVEPMVLMIAIATFFDGVAITNFPELYGGAGQRLSFGAAWILWGVGCFLLAALIMKKRV